MTIKKNKFYLITSAFLIFFLLLSTVHLFFAETRATTIQAVDSNTYTLDSEFGFKFKYIPGVTTYQVSSGAIQTGDRYSFSATSNEDFINKYYNGGAWARYNNVGVFKGQIIDLKISLVSAERIVVNEWFNFQIGVQNNSMADINVCNMVNPIFKYEFFNHGTNTPANLKGNVTFSDVDDAQGLEILSGGSHMYYENTDWFYQSGNAVLSHGERDSEGWERFAKITVNYTNPLTIKYHTQNTEGAWFGFSPTAVASFDTPTITKSVSGSNIHNTNGFYYDLNFSVPSVDDAFKYSQFEISDYFSNAINFNTNNIVITNDAGTNVNGKFNISKSGNRLLITLRDINDTSFYEHDYRVRINCSRTAGYDVSSLGNVIPNEATITTNKGTKTSNKVNVSFNHNITSSVTNGTITPSVYGVGATSNKTFNYAPVNNDYVLNYVKVDGSNIDITKYPTSFPFNNINNNHTIEANYRRVYHIDTSTTNGGTITPNISKIEKGQTKTISYQPNKGYYIESVAVDGRNIDVTSNKLGYTFSNITADHSVHVVFKPYIKVQLTKELYGSSNEQLFSLSDFNKYGLSSNKYYFKIELKDLATNEIFKILANNQTPITFDYLKVGHSYQIVESPTNNFIFSNIVGRDSANIKSTVKNNIVNFTISGSMTNPETYKIISKSNIGQTAPGIYEEKENLIKLQ